MRPLRVSFFKTRPSNFPTQQSDRLPSSSALSHSLASPPQPINVLLCGFLDLDLCPIAGLTAFHVLIAHTPTCCSAALELQGPPSSQTQGTIMAPSYWHLLLLQDDIQEHCSWCFQVTQEWRHHWSNASLDHFLWVCGYIGNNNTIQFWNITAYYN